MGAQSVVFESGSACSCLMPDSDLHSDSFISYVNFKDVCSESVQSRSSSALANSSFSSVHSLV